MTISSGYSYQDYPDEGWMAGKWDWTHSIGCAIAIFLYIIPGIIFAIWKALARQSHLSRYEQVKNNNQRAFEYTGCNYLFPVLHLGGHPFLPYNQRILIGLDKTSLNFYTYNLKKLHSVTLQDIKIANQELQHNALTPSTQTVSFDPNTLKLKILVEDVICTTEFNIAPNDPRYFWQVLNQMLIR